MARPTYDQLLQENKALRARVAELEARVRRLEELLDKAVRGNQRQAAPFSKGQPKENPKKPGRKAGKRYGSKAHRPPPQQKPDEIIDVPLPQQCSDCGGHIQEKQIDQQYQVEIPRQPRLRRFDIHVGECQQCGKRVRPRHELQTSDAVGAACSQLGSEAQAFIAVLSTLTFWTFLREFSSLCPFIA